MSSICFCAKKCYFVPRNLQQLSPQITMAMSKAYSPMMATSMLSNKAITGAQHHSITPNDPRFESRNSTAPQATYETLVAAAFRILHTSRHDIVPVPPFKMPQQGRIKLCHRLRPPHKPRHHYPPALLRHKRKLNEVCTSMIVDGIIEHSACVVPSEPVLKQCQLNIWQAPILKRKIAEISSVLLECVVVGKPA